MNAVRKNIVQTKLAPKKKALREERNTCQWTTKEQSDADQTQQTVNKEWEQKKKRGPKPLYYSGRAFKAGRR